MLVQFTVNATNICLNLAIMLYFSTDNINRIFYFFYLFAVSLQTFPACYYGSKVEHGFEQLRHAAFQSDWIQQNRNYKTYRFSIMAFFLISEHIKFLHRRISRIGHCKNSQIENEKDFQNCINAQQCLYDCNYFSLCYHIEDIVAFPLFLQFTVTGITTCMAMSVALFFVEDTFTRLYFAFYVICVLMGLFPVCYMGSELEHAFEQLHWSIYYSDWINQSTAYKKDMLIFNERALKQRAVLAGGIFRIHLQTFLSTCKGAYSMFAVVLRFKNE
ncbi:odorant receptor 59a-like [Teleopsis dalmanni]|uniref:odorant receptor 59a-like n=1 Tax=Teleopsis dalmanni TaxID=139649 RepID=UPI0018CCEDDC|nr:odorant receptor 59a-like [Teleopsis dalmanni]